MANDTTRPTDEQIDKAAEQIKEMIVRRLKATIDDAVPQVEFLQRELAEAREQSERLVAAMREALILANGNHLPTAKLLSSALDAAPAPSDVKGEPAKGLALQQIAMLLGWSEERAALATDGELTKYIFREIATLGARASLTPLTDPSVDAIFTLDGEPTRDLIEGRWYKYEDAYMLVNRTVKATFAQQPVKLRPASDFGVAAPNWQAVKCPECGGQRTDNTGWCYACGEHTFDIVKAADDDGEPAARGEPGLKKLEPEWRVYRPKRKNDDPRLGCTLPFIGGEWVILDPALYGLSDGGGRIKELEAELADWKQDSADELCVNCADPLDYQRRADDAVRSEAERQGIRIKELETAADLRRQTNATLNSEAERLRNAIEEHRSHDGREFEACPVDEKLYAALSPSPAAASGEKHDQSCDCPACDDGNEPPPAAESEGGENNTRRIFDGTTVDIRWLNGLVDENAALSARLAACEERCLELDRAARQANGILYPVIRGHVPGQRASAESCRLWFGISRDEWQRMRTSNVSDCVKAAVDVLNAVLAPKAGGEQPASPSTERSE